MEREIRNKVVDDSHLPFKKRRIHFEESDLKVTLRTRATEKIDIPESTASRLSDMDTVKKSLEFRMQANRLALQ